jgi:hypothetical protein
MLDHGLRPSLSQKAFPRLQEVMKIRPQHPEPNAPINGSLQRHEAIRCPAARDELQQFMIPQQGPHRHGRKPFFVRLEAARPKKEMNAAASIEGIGKRTEVVAWG